MRSASFIEAVWATGGPFRSNGVVTVQLPWSSTDSAVADGDEGNVIHPTWTQAGNRAERGLPIRWFQKFDNSQTERVVPNIKSISTDRSVDSDAATCQIVLSNQWMYKNGEVPLQEPMLSEGNRHLAGYFTPSRGNSPDAQARWGHSQNEWSDILVPNAILRTYQGYGGQNKTVEEALADGNLIQTGLWLVDEVRISTNGEMNLGCRDMGKLLVDQQLYLPLVPTDKYPLTYYRWVIENFLVNAAAKRVTTSNSVHIAVGNKTCRFVDSSVDRWYPEGATGSDISDGGYLLHGHRGRDSIDGSTGTYWLGEGNSGPNRTFATSWIEYSCGEFMNAVYVNPWAGNYEMYVSVKVNGSWQGSQTVPYSEAELLGNQPYVVDTGADIPYVAKFGVPWETAKEYVLPRAYKAERVRVSFRRLAYSGIGPWQYRAGVREFRIRATASAGTVTTSSTNTWEPYFWAADGLRDPSDLNRIGYITCSQFGDVDAFGDCRTYPKSGGNAVSNGQVYWIALTASGDGYWVLRDDGRVSCYGAAQFFGSPYSDGLGASGGQDARGGRWGAICPTPEGDGYWVVAVDGRIINYGAATSYSNVTPGEFIAGAKPLAQGGHGLFLADTDGTVHVRGGATHYGNFTASSDSLSTVVPNMGGNGYWMMDAGGRVQAAGAAVDYGENADPDASDYGLLFDQLIPVPSNLGYYIMIGRGQITAFGDAYYFGSPIAGSTGQIRQNGNYTDYSDIIKDLALFSGFLLYRDTLAGNEEPYVYGNIESTGAFAEEQLPDDIFDKRPVIDAMHQIKEVVGYLLYVDEEGGLHFESPNFWSYGNTLQETGERVSVLPEIDERKNLIDYGVSWDDQDLRSLIIISSEDPAEAGDTTITTKLIPQSAKGLKGLLKPAMWVNGWFQFADEQKIMAELIALHSWFTQRLGQVSCAANPTIQINDQVRVYERQTSETFIHYVRGINTTHDLDTGSYTMTLTTHWLGSGDEWAVTDNTDLSAVPQFFVMSPELQEWVARRNIASGVGPYIPGSTRDDMPLTNLGTDPDGLDGSPDEGSG